jgi:maleylacetate reductase
MTSIYGLSEGGVKRTGRDDRVRPRSVFYDPELYRSLPADVTAASGINALAHCVEALYSADANPLLSAVALRGARSLYRGLPVAVERGDDAGARAESVLGAHLAGIALSGAGGSVHHQICHALGGAFDLDHAGTHSVLLPQVMAYVRPLAPEAFADLAEALGVDDPVAGVESLARRVGAPVALGELGMTEDQLAPTADLIAERTKSSPYAVSREDALVIVTGAYHGRTP